VLRGFQRIQPKKQKVEGRWKVVEGKTFQRLPVA
jgi:hypothetical protein